jgi:hypothetical protein
MTTAFLDADRIICSYTADGQRLGPTGTLSGDLRPLDVAATGAMLSAKGSRSSTSVRRRRRRRPSSARPVRQPVCAGVMVLRHSDFAVDEGYLSIAKPIGSPLRAG